MDPNTRFSAFSSTPLEHRWASHVQSFLHGTPPPQRKHACVCMWSWVRSFLEANEEMLPTLEEQRVAATHRRQRKRYHGNRKQILEYSRQYYAEHNTEIARRKREAYYRSRGMEPPAEPTWRFRRRLKSANIPDA